MTFYHAGNEPADEGEKGDAGPEPVVDPSRSAPTTAEAFAGASSLRSVTSQLCRSMRSKPIVGWDHVTTTRSELVGLQVDTVRASMFAVQCQLRHVSHRVQEWRSVSIQHPSWWGFLKSS